MQWKKHKCSSPSLPNSSKATKAYVKIRKEEQTRKSAKTPRSISNMFTSVGIHDPTSYIKFRRTGGRRY
jgi:hypothetical protein